MANKPIALWQLALATAFVVAAWTETGHGAAPPPPRRPNILFIMADDHAAHALSCYGSRLNKTPNLDRIAAAGMRLTNCFVTNSICTPSRAAILTGTYSHINGVSVFNRFDGSQTTFPKLLQRAGYQTAVIGKWHLFSDPTGFDYWNVLPGQGLYHDPVLIEMGVERKHRGYVTDIITDLALKWLGERDARRPFCLLYHHKAPHREWSPDAKHARLYDDVELPLPENFFDDYRGRSPAAAEATMRIARDLRPTDLKRKPPAGLDERAAAKWNYQTYIKDYLRCVASLDENVGRVLDYLDQSGLAENTIVIYTSDQGFFLGEHGWYDKRFMYEESLRMPFLVRYPPAIRPGTTCDRMALNVDFAPTLLEFAGVDVPKEMQGRSLKPLLEGKPAPADWRTSMYYRYYHYPQDHRVQPHFGVRTLRHKLIHFDKLDAWELFDLERDPREMHNLYADPQYATTVRTLKEELARLRRELRDDDTHVVPSAAAQNLGAEIIAHRGASHVAPENTLAAIRAAWQLSADAVEFDVRLTKDGQIVLMHDEDLKRTAGVPGFVAESTLDGLRRLDVGRWKGARFAGERIPTLAEALGAVAPGKRTLIEVKCGVEILPELARVLGAAKLAPRQTAIVSFSPDVVAAVKQAFPDRPAYWIVDLKPDKDKTPWTTESLLAEARRIKADGLDLSAGPWITEKLVKASKEAKLPVYVWTVNDPAEAKRMIAAGVAGITTDRPALLRGGLGR